MAAFNKKAKDVMTKEPASATPQTKLPEVAKQMLRHDCGEIPVLNSEQKPIGVVTDRDIVCRVIAENKNPAEATAEECMSSPCITVKEDASIDECMEIMQRNQIRRLPVVDRQERLCGIVAQADIARSAPTQKSGQVLKQVSAAV